jgi:hypothetical protein
LRSGCGTRRAGADADNSPDLVPARQMQLTLRGSVAEKRTGTD